MNEKEDTSEKKKSTATIKAEAREKRLAELEAKLNAKENEIKAQTTAIEQTYENIEKPSKEVEKPIEGCHVPNKTEPAPQVVKQQPVEEQTKTDAFGDIIPPSETNDFENGFRSGFETMKSIVVNYIETEQKITRKGIIDFVKSKKHDDVVI